MVTPKEGDLTCQELVEIVTDYFEGALPEGDRVRLEAHLRTCEGCRRYLEQMRLTIRLTGTLSEESLEPDVKAQLVRAFRGWSQNRT